MLLRHSLKLAAACALLSPILPAAQAQESSALVDALVRKGVLTTQEAEEVRAEMTREHSATPAGKIKLSNPITELKLYGDVRLRHQYDRKDPQADPFPVGVDSSRTARSPQGNQRSRWRFRLRLNADFRLMEDFFGGIELQTGQASDSGNQTFENGFDDYSIFISRAYVGWNASDWLTLTAGKVPNPFYTTDLIWDSDINPTGITQSFAFHKMRFGSLENAPAPGYSKDGKSIAPAPSIRGDSPWELTLVAGQFIFDDNIEGGGSDNGATRDNDSTTDAYLFQTQLIASYKFDKDIKLTIAPGWMTYINGSVGGLLNENSFQDNAFVSGATRNLNLLLLPGDLSFKLGSVKTKFLWDFAYNIEGRKRVEDIYRLVTIRSGGVGEREVRSEHTSQDNFAFLIGMQFGENKKKGDWSLLANYRQTGIGAVDPNLNDSDFGLGELNTRGFKVGAAFNFTDFMVGGVTYMYAWNLRDNLFGGEATGGNAIADSNNVQVLQVDLNIKF